MGNYFDQFDAGVGDGASSGAESDNYFDQFDNPESNQAEPSGLTRRLVGDTAVSALKGAIGVPEAVVGLADIATGGQAGKLAEDAGFRPKEAKAMLDDLYSPEQRAANSSVAAEDGFVDKLGAIADSPSVIPHAIIESAPAMLAGGVVGKGVKAIGAVKSAMAAGAIGEGAMMAGSAAENIRQQTEDGLMTGKQQLAALATGVVGGVIGAGGAKVGQKLGLGDVDTALVSGALGTSARSMPARVAGGAVQEGALEEMPQSMAETALQNYAMDRDLSEGLGGAAAMGLATGSAMGAGFGALSGQRPQVQPAPTPENPAPAPVARPDPNNGPLSAAAFLLPAPAERLGLPAPDTMYADSQGNVNSTGPTVNVDGVNQTAQQQGPTWVNPANSLYQGGAGMDQQAAQGEPAGREGDFIPRSRAEGGSQRQPETIDGEVVPSPKGLPAPQRQLADGRQDSGVIETNATGESRQTKIGNVPPKDFVPQGGRGMDQQIPVGQKYSNPIQAKNAIQKAGAAATHEAVQVGPKQFEVQPIAAPAESAAPAPAIQSQASPAPQPVAKPKGARKIVDRERDTVAHAVMRLGGIDIGNRQDTTGETKGNSGLPGVGYVWSKSGTGLDEMASKLNEQGFVPADEMNNLGGVPWLQSVLGDHMSGRKEHFAPGSARQEAESLKQEADRQEARAAQEEAGGDFDSAEAVTSDLLDDYDLLEIRAAAADKHAAELDEIFGDGPNETVAGTQNADRPSEEAQRPETVGSGSAGSGQRPQGGQPDARAESPTEEAPSLELSSQTEAELASAEAAKKQRAKEEAAAQAIADEKKRKADERAFVKQQNESANNDFQLGQNADDNVSGQGGMFDEPAKPEAATGKAKTDPDSYSVNYDLGERAFAAGAPMVPPNKIADKEGAAGWMDGWEDARKKGAVAQGGTGSLSHLREIVRQSNVSQKDTVATATAAIFNPDISDAQRQSLLQEVGATGATSQAELTKALNKWWLRHGKERAAHKAKGKVLADDFDQQRRNQAVDDTLVSAMKASAEMDAQQSEQKALPEIFQVSRKRYIDSMGKAAGLKKDSLGYSQAIRSIETKYDEALDEASARLTFEQYHERNSDSPASVNRQAWEQLRKEFGVTEQESPANQTPVKDAAPANTDDQSGPVAPVKWFGSQNKAEAFLKGKKLQATHEVVEADTGRFEVREKAQPVAELVAAEQASAESGSFGPILREFKHDAQGAIAKLTELQDGEAVAALHHPEVGDIDLVWGVEPSDKAEGYGLAKIIQKHPEVVDDLQGFLSGLHKDESKSGKNRVRLVNDSGDAVVSLDWKGSPKAWLLTAYERKAEVGTLMDTAGIDTKDDTARLDPSPESTVAQPVAAKPAAEPKAKLEDFGETLHGARKFLDFTQKMSAAQELDVAAVPLSKSWPAPDYQKMLDEGAAPWGVAFMRAAREEIPNKPTASWKLKRWTEQVELMREMAMKAASDPSFAEKAQKRAGEYAKLDRGFLGLVELYERFGHGVSLKGVNFTDHFYSLYRGEKNVTKWAVQAVAQKSAMSNWPRELAVSDTKEGALETFSAWHAKQLAAPDAEQAGPSIRFDIFSDRLSKSVFIAKKNGKRLVRMKSLDSVKEARAYLKDNQAELETQYEAMKIAPAARNAENAPRVGGDYRNGQDVTQELFTDAFGFRGVQFGNWVEGKRRQKDLNDAYDGLMDLAGILNIPARALSLNGQLGLAFGARGHGGPDPAAAHYESDSIVINLTKKAGSGSLGHEWWHALDNYFSRARKGDGFLSETPYERGPGVRPELVAAFKELMRAVGSTSLKQRSEERDKFRSSDYWSSGREMTARAFESFLIAKLEDNGIRSDYLANIASGEAIEREADYPYPTAAELPVIRAAYDNLFSVIESKQDDAGNVALFSRADLSASSVVQGEAPSKPINLEVAEAAAQQFLADYNGNIELTYRIRKTQDELYGPESIAKIGIIKGAYHPGRGLFTLAADHLSSATDAHRTLRHEVLGHYGLDTFNSVDKQAFLDKILASKNEPSLKEVWKDIAGLYSDKSQNVQAEEVFARLAEIEPSAAEKAIDYLRAAITKLLRKIGYKKAVITRSELLREVEVISKGIRNGSRQRQNFGSETRLKREPTDAQYRLNTQPTKGIPLFSAKAIAKKLNDKLGLSVKVAATEADLPAEIQAQIKRDGASGKVGGVFHNGQSYIIASNLTDTQHAVRLVLHEAIGHGGVQAVLGDKLGTAMRSIYRDMPAAMRRELESRYAGKLAGLSQSAREQEVAEEYVAHLAEHDPQNSVLERIVALIRKFIRDTFGEQAALKWSRNDIVQLLAEAKRAARNDGPRGGTAQMSGDADPAEALRIQQSVKGKSLLEVAGVMAQSKNPAVSTIAAKVQSTLGRLESEGVKLGFEVVHRGAPMPAEMANSRGFTDFEITRNGEKSIVVWINGADVTGYAGMEEEIILHELVHAATSAAFAYGRDNPNTFTGRAAQSLIAVSDAIAAHINQRFTDAESGKAELSDFEQSVRDGLNNAFATDDEVLAWALSSRDAQAYLEGIPYKGNTLWSRFVNAVRVALGMNAAQETALSEVLAVAEQLMSRDAANMAQYRAFGKQGRHVIQQASDSWASRSQQGGTRYRNAAEQDEAPALMEVSEADEAEFVASLKSPGAVTSIASAMYKAKGTESPFFQRWFAKSKMVDRSGAPVAFVHRSFGDMSNFDDARLGSSTGTATAALGHFLARKDVGNVERYGPVADQFFIRMEKPKVITQDQFSAMGDWSVEQVKAYRAKLMGEGFDGMYVQGLAWPIVFEGKNIKGKRNTGTFDATANTRYSLTADARSLFDRATGPAPLERDDPFAAENRRLREGEKTLWQKAKKEFTRQFSPGGLLPDTVFAEKITRDSEFQAVEFDVRHLSGGLNAAVKADYGVELDNLTAEQMKPLAEALAGKVDPAIPEATRVAIVAMRQYIDSLSGEYLSILQKQVEANMEGADQALIDKITGNLGSYVNRSYQAFDDPKWFKTVPTDVVNAARVYLAKGYMEHGDTPAEAARLADVTVNEMLKTGTAYDSMGAFIAEGKLGAKDLTVLIKRKEIAPEIRALLGEYMDPRLNFAKSATKMGRMVWNQRFLDRVLEFGMGSLFFKGKDRPADATTQIAGDKSESYAPLNGLWTFPEVAQSFQDALGKEQMSDLYRTVVRLNGMVKYGKTILSPTTAMRNWQSAMFFSLANGHFDLSQMKHSWSAMREQVTQNATGDDLAYLRKLKQLGVVYDTPYAGEMMALLQDARMDELLSSKSGTGLKWLRKVNQFAQGFYSFGDDFWKIIGFENEKAGLIKAGIPEAQAETMAAERIRNTYPTYSMIGKAVQWLRRFPLMGTFVSFPSEIIRTTVNMMQLTAADLKSDNPGIRAIGRKRAAGMAMVSAGFYALSAMTAAALGVGDDEEEALRDLSAPWSKNSTFLYTGRDADGKLRYFDMSFLDPYGYWKRPLTAMMRDQPWEKAAASGISDMLSPFFGADITAGAIFEVLSNKKPTGGQVYNANAGSVDQLQDISNHMRKALQPGFFSNAERLWKAGNSARHEGSGQPYDMRDEVVSLLGWRAATLDTQTGLYYRSFDFTDALTDAKKTLTRTLRSSNDVSEGDIQESKQAANAQYQKAFTEMGRLVSSAEAAGMSRREVMQTLKLSGVAQRNIVALLNGRVPEMDIGMQAQAKAVKQAGVMRGSEHAAEIARRFRLAREQ